jgi:transposase InsO family protein
MPDSDSDTSTRRDVIRKLEGELNYKPWLTQIRLHLGRRGLWEIANGEELRPGSEEPKELAQWYNKAKKASYMILLSLKEGPLEHVDTMPVSNPKAILNTLEQLYGTRGDAARFYRFKDLVTTTLEGCTSVTNYIDMLKLHFKRLEELDGKLPEWVLTSLILFGLGDGYDSYVVNIVTAMRTATPNLNEVISGVIDEERRQRGKELGTALATRARSKDNKDKRCTHCKRKGHAPSECWEEHPEKRPEGYKPKKKAKKDKEDSSKEKDKGKKREEPVGMMVHMAPTSRSAWIFDSGATHHMCNNKELFEMLSPLNQTARVANNSSLAIRGKGTVKFDWESTTGTLREISLSNVLYAPELTSNLLAYEALAQKGARAVLEPTGTTIWKGNIQLGHCIRKNGLMLLKTPDLTNEVIASALAVQVTSPEVWHRRMAHMGYDKVKQLVEAADRVKIAGSEPQGACETCNKGKATKRISQRPPKRATEKLELVHSDVGGAISPTTLQGHRYYVTFTDDYSRAVWISFMKNKSEALQKFKEFKAYAENQSGCTIKRLRTDNGGEYIETAAKAFYKEHGIQWEPTARYSPQQNGVSERLNRTIMERARCMLYESNLSKKLWNEAAGTVVYLKNRSPGNAIATGKTPYELWHGKKPNLEHIRIFGSKCYIYVPDTTKRKKLDARSVTGYLLGYDASNIYRVWQPKTRRVLRIRDVNIDETTIGMTPIPETSGTRPAELVLPWPKDENNNQSDSESDSGGEAHEESNPALELEQHGTQDENSEPEQPEEPEEPEELQEAPRASRRANKGTRGPTYIDELEQQIVNEQRRQIERWEQRKNAAKRQGEPLDAEHSTQLGDPSTSLAFIYLAAVSSSGFEPRTYREALESANSENWIEAMDAEIDSLQKNGTWILEDPPANRKPLRGKWVYKRKLGSKGQVLKYKARWVVKGFLQKPGIDYDETYAAVVKTMSYKALFALAAMHDLEIEQMDFIGAFLHSKLKELVYVQQPTGYDDGTKRACRLIRALYGLKQSPRAWYETLIDFLHKLGYTRTDADYSVLYNSAGIIVAIYVDDLLIFGKQLDLIRELEAELKASFSMTDLGPCAYYLGIEVIRDREQGTITLCQTEYIKRVLETFGMADCRPVATPLEKGAQFVQNEGQATEEDIQHYQQIIGSLMYAMTETRPDLAIVVSILSQFLANPSKEHQQAAKRSLRYLQGSKDYGLTLGKLAQHELGQLHGYVDASYAQNLVDRRSTTGYVFMLGNGAISWTSKRQPTVALSSCEAEYMAETQAAKEAIWLRRLLLELGHTGPDVQTIQIYADNQGSIALAKNPEYHARTKHIDTQWHFVREQVGLGTIKLTYIPTTEQLADGLTKALGGPEFQKFVRGLGLGKVNRHASNRARSD